MAGGGFFVADEVHVVCLGEVLETVEFCDCFGIALNFFSESGFEGFPGDASAFICGQEVLGCGKDAWSGDSYLDGVCGEGLPSGDVAFFQHSINEDGW